MAQKPLPQGIGTLGEKTLHRVLKAYFQPDPSKCEVRVGPYVADALTGSGIVEIQTRSFYKLRPKLRQHRTIAEASAVESPIRQETIGFPAHFFARAHNFKPPGRACQPEADSPMRT